MPSILSFLTMSDLINIKEKVLSINLHVVSDRTTRPFRLCHLSRLNLAYMSAKMFNLGDFNYD